MSDRVVLQNDPIVTRASGPCGSFSFSGVLDFQTRSAPAAGPCHGDGCQNKADGFRSAPAHFAVRGRPRSFSLALQKLCGFAFIALATIILTGCQSDPFTRPALSVLNHPDPRAICRDFSQSIPDEFTTDDTIVLQFPFNIQFVMLGVLNVNRPADTFEFYALNQAGIAYFHLAGDHGNLAIREALGPWMEHKDILLSIAADIQNIYFAPVPQPKAHVQLKPTIVRFDQKAPGGYLIYDFGGQPITLLQKQLAGFFGPLWTARYYDFQPGDKGKWFPRGIVLDNSRYFYRLIIKNRDWSTDIEP